MKGVFENMKNYTKLEVTSYVKQGLESSIMIPRQAEKFARIIARQENIGESVISWSVDSQWNEIQEKMTKFKLILKQISLGGSLLK